MKKKYVALKYVRFSIADYFFDMSLPLLGAGVFFFQNIFMFHDAHASYLSFFH